MKTTRYAIGDIASLEPWDDTVPPRNRMGMCKVVAVETGCRSESGVMVTVESKDGRQQTLDAHWLMKEPTK